MGQAPMGYGDMGAFGVMGAQPGGFGGYGGMGVGSMGGMGGQGAMGGMGAPPGGFMASLVDPSPSTSEDAQHGGGADMENVDK